MDNRALANEIKGLGDKIDTLIVEMGYLRDDLEKSREDNGKLKFRISELEKAISGME